jgi:nucleoredoxin
MFTPMLASWYTKHAASKNAEVIFVSSDRSKSDFEGYLREMPWGLSTGFESPVGRQLGSKFGVQGIPTLVTMDVASGEVISKDARSGIMSKPDAWPFRPPSLTEVLSSAKFVKGGKTQTIADIKARADYAFFYFSAHWCGPCRSFTPRFAEWYSAKVGGMPAGKKFETIFVSGDRDAASFSEYAATMPWLALDFAQRDVAEELNTVSRWC